MLLPDTQRYSQNFPATFRNQARWIVDNKQRRNIAFVLHEGDIVNRRYKIVKINANNIEVLDVLNNNRQTIPLTAS